MAGRALTLVCGLTMATALAGCSSSAGDEQTEALSGTFRVAVSEQDVRDAGLGNGPGWSGTWTLTVENGTYTLTCVPLGQPGIDCGNHPDPASVAALEAGAVTADDGVATFRYDPQVLSELTGCAVGTQSSEGAEACPPGFAYTATWTADGDAVTVSDVDGQEGSYLVVKPWQSIG